MNMTRIFLIDPPFDKTKYGRFSKRIFPVPLWALSLAAYLKERALSDFTIKIVDGRLISLEEILKLIEVFNPFLVGMSPSFASYSETLKLAKKSKSIGAKVVLGGHHAAGLAKEIMRNRGPYSKDYCIDVVINRDGEKAFCEYAIGMEKKRIKNLVYQTKDRVIENPIELLDLNKIPVPDRDLVNLEDFFKKYQRKYPAYKNRRFLTIYSRKGCAWRKQSKGGCIFCSRMDKEVRLKSPFAVWEEIKSLVTNYGANHIFDVSDDFLGDREWFDEFYEIARRNKKYNPELRIYARADRITKKIARMLKELNVWGVALGIESGARNSLSSLRKGMTKTQNRQAVKLLAQERINIFTSFILGAPGENRKSLRETLFQMKEFSRVKAVYSMQCQQLIPLPNSTSWELLKRVEKKYKNKDLIDWEGAKQDWLNNFCHLDIQDIKEVKGEISKILEKYKNAPI